MSQLQLLNVLIKERLTAAAVEIFGAIEKTLVVRYQEEITRSKQENKRLQRQLDMLFKPEIKLHRSDSKKAKFPASVEVVLDPRQLQYESSPSSDQDNSEPSPLLNEECESGDDEHHLNKQDSHADTDMTDTDSLTNKQIKLEEDAENYRERESVDDPSAAADPDWSPGDGVAKTSGATHQAQLRSGNEVHRCRVCPRCFGSARGLQLHLKSSHAKKKKEEKGVDCHVCGKHINSKMHLKYHLRIHTGERPFVCHICGQGFKSKSHLKEHLVRHTGERKFTCQTCGNRFFSISSMRTHIRKLHNQTRLTCNTCDKTFASQYSLDVHLRQHTENRPFSCQFCTMLFRTQSHLADHTRTHTGERPFKCTVCGAAYKQSNALMTHLRMKHNFIKVHKCRDCGKPMREENVNLRGKREKTCSACKTHRKNQDEKPFSCHVCDEIFQHVDNMKKHIESEHEGQQPFRCVGCGVSFSEMCSFQEHVKVAHGGKPTSLTDMN